MQLFSLKQTLTILFLVNTAIVYPCTFPTYYPGEYWMFYVYDQNRQPQTTTAKEQNITEWQKYTAGKATFNDIREVVYRYPLEALERMGGHSFSKQDTLYRNSFVKYLIDTNDHEAINYLILAKKCEKKRAIHLDPWWYPTKDDLQYTDLRGILDEALAYKGSKFKVRYWLQAIRAAYTIGEHDLCLQLWHDHIQQQPASSVRTMCEDYIGGIYFKKGDYETAIRHYANTTQQSNSFWWCADNLTQTKSGLERIELLYRYCPTSPELAVMLQKMCREAEEGANYKVFCYEDIVNCSECLTNDNDKSYHKTYLNNNGYLDLRDFALKAASEGRSDNPAMWQYAASFLTMLNGDAPLAFQYITDAAPMRGTAFVKDNIKVLHLMLDAMTGDYDEDFEERILPQMQWLDGKIRNQRTQKVKDDYWEYSDYLIFSNHSNIYFNDMMRKITLSVMAPRYQCYGQPVKALMLIGMASERMRTLTGFRNQSHEWNMDYYTDIFLALDSAPIEDVIAYRETVRQQGGDNDFDRFLAARCYQHGSYFNELIGTKYMREEQFDKAIEYLSKVPAAYDATLNIYPHYIFDPFNKDFHIGRRYKIIDPAPGYKRHFARKMLSFQNEMNTAKNKEAKALATYQYAVGLMHATSDCWALLHYKQGDIWHGNAYHLNDRNPAMEEHYRELFDYVLETTQSNELKAKCLAAQVWMLGDDTWKYERIATGSWANVKNPNSIFAKIHSQFSSPPFADTEIAKLLFTECDVFRSYAKE